MIIICGNSPEYSAIAEAPPLPLMDRVLLIPVEESSIIEWGQWMEQRYEDKWDRRTFAFLMAYERDYFLLQLPEEAYTMQQYPTPRSWTKVARLGYYGMSDIHTLTGLLGESVGKDYWAFLQSEIDIQELIRNPSKFPSLNVDTKFMACHLLANRISKKWQKDMWRLIETMTETGHEFLVLLTLSISKQKRQAFIIRLFQKYPHYGDILYEVTEIAESIRSVR